MSGFLSDLTSLGIGTGSASISRRQEWVEVIGTFEDFPYSSDGCCCMLAPPSGYFRPSLCSAGCPTKVIRKRYHHCSERDVVEKFLDFKRLNLILDHNVTGPVEGYLSEEEDDNMIGLY